MDGNEQLAFFATGSAPSWVVASMVSAHEQTICSCICSQTIIFSQLDGYSVLNLHGRSIFEHCQTTTWTKTRKFSAAMERGTATINCESAQMVSV